jgi:hypothetical protein
MKKRQMIKANEIRIGNLFLDDKNNTVQIEALS